MAHANIRLLEEPSPQDVNALLARFNEARYAEAANLAEAMTRRHPRHPFGWKAWGETLRQLGRNDEALKPVQEAVGLGPKDAEVHNILGIILSNLGRLEEAAVSYRRAVELKPDFAEAHNNLGNALTTLGQLAEAAANYRRAVELRPDHAPAHNNLGAVLKDLGQLDQAAASCRRAVELNPDYARAHNNLGVVLKDLGQLGEAARSCRRAVKLKPDDAEAHNNLGIVLKGLGQLDDAVASYRQALGINPNFAEAHNNLGNALRDLRQLEEAAARCRRAVEINPKYAEAHNNLGAVLNDLGQLDEAVASCRRALKTKPDFAQAHSNLGGILNDCGQLTEAVASYRRALELKPDYAQARSNLILALLYQAGHDAGVVETELREWNARHGVPLAPLILPHANDRSRARRLRIGYVSPDFRSHPVGRFLLPLLTAHDHQAFEIFCYSAVPHADGLTARLRSQADGWRELTGHTDREAADLIRADRIDLLVDLALHTANNRLAVFALKPAPVQVTYLAYPGNSGLDTIDYRITDVHLDPPGRSSPHGAEQPLRLPETYWCYQPVIDPAPAINSLPASSAGHVTFGCLNSFCKVTPGVLAAWTRILVAAPGASLVLHAQPGAHRLRAQEFFAAHGVDPQRLRFVARTSLEEYFQLYQLIDIALDPFPFQGGTTTCDALWMGVPVVSLAGATPVTRGGLSLLTNVGLPEFVAYSVEDYADNAIAVARDLPRLATLRSGLRERMQCSPLMDGPRFARNLESAYRTMWSRWCEGT